MEEDSLGLEWLGDVPQDEIVVAAAKVLGLDRLTKQAVKSEGGRDFWLAGRLWSIASGASGSRGAVASLSHAHRTFVCCLFPEV